MIRSDRAHKKIARSSRKHRELVLNYFRAQQLLSRSIVEGLNNEAKDTMRDAYGFRTFRASRTRPLSLTSSVALKTFRILGVRRDCNLR